MIGGVKASLGDALTGLLIQECDSRGFNRLPSHEPVPVTQAEPDTEPRPMRPPAKRKVNPAQDIEEVRAKVLEYARLIDDPISDERKYKMAVNNLFGRIRMRTTVDHLKKAFDLGYRQDPLAYIPKVPGLVRIALSYATHMVSV